MLTRAKRGLDLDSEVEGKLHYILISKEFTIGKKNGN